MFGPRTPEFTAGMSVSAAVDAFNECYSDHPIGKRQPPLTESELVAALRWAVMKKPSGTTGAEEESYRKAKELAERRVLPENWQIVAWTRYSNEAGKCFLAWNIKVVMEQPARDSDHQNSRSDVDGYCLPVRHKNICEWNENASPPGPVELPSLAPSQNHDGSMPLAAAIHEFNTTNFRIEDVTPAPLTLREVVSSIKRVDREKRPLTDRKYDAFKKIPKTLRLPPGYQLSLVSNFEPGDGYRYGIWSVRLVIPRTSKTGHTYGHIIRNQFVDAKKVKDGEIAWGPVAENGLQSGVRPDPNQDDYAPGNSVVPEFFIRNTGQKVFELPVPNRADHSYYKRMVVIDSDGQEIRVTSDDTDGPAWLMPLSSFGSGSQANIPGVRTYLGGCPERRDPGGVCVCAEPGQSIRVSYSLPNPGGENAGELRTGEVLFELRK